MEPLTLTAIGLAAKYVPDILHYFNKDGAASVAGKVIEIAQTVTNTKSGIEAEKVLDANPELAIQFKTAVMLNETELDRMFLADVQSARDRDAKLAAAGVKNYRANVLTAMAVLLVFVCLLVVVWSTGMNEYAKGLITLVCGRALGWVEQVFSFEFGTTRSSRANNNTMLDIAKRVNR